MSKNGLNRWLVAAAAACWMVGCGGDTSAPEDGADDVAAGDDDAVEPEAGDDDAPTPAPTEPEPSDPAANDPPFDMTDPATLADGAYECSYTRVPNEKITDFSIWDAGSWGDAMSLTGGEFQYKNDGVTDSEQLTIEVDTAAGTAHITGNIIGGYAGWGLWFGPCTNASRWQGIRFVMGGSIGASGQLEFQVQTNNNYPIDTSNMKGACPGSWSDGCESNRVRYETEFPAEPAEILAPWTSLTGGVPNAVESAELLGLQWQFNCPEDEICEVDVILDEVTFY